MFNGYGALSLESDHLNISFGKPESWSSFTPLGSIKALIFDFGNENMGPVVQLGLMTTVDGEVLDWPHSIDPPHFHGSDQFRVVVDGEWNLAGKKQVAGGYSLQESGRIYREHPGDGGATWLMSVIGDRRGAKAEIIRAEDRETLVQIDSEYFKPTAEDEAYPHPAGSKGIPAIASTNGDCVNGYLRNHVDDLSINTVSSCLFGEKSVGPVAHVMSFTQDLMVMPRSQYATERLFAVTSGTCTIGATEYKKGDIRIQNADAPMEEIISGPNGVQLTMVVADRSADLSFDSAATDTPTWITDAIKLREKLPS